jgi:hypothetical protein
VATLPGAPPTAPHDHPAPVVEPAISVADASPEDRLAELAWQSVEYVQQLKRDRQLSVPETYIAASWVLTEATEQKLPVTIDQIDSAVRGAFARLDPG